MLVNNFTKSRVETEERFRAAVDLVAPQLAIVEERIQNQSRAFDEAIEGYVSYACGGAGKRLRPLVALLSGGATGGATGAHVDLAVILELIHIATLVHDDIMDGAELRRDRPTTNAKWGNALSVLLGDCLFAHALRLATQFEDQSISRRIADASSEVCTGEIIQTQRRFDLNLSEDDYLRIIEMKTAALFAVAGEIGAYLSGADDATTNALREFGRKFGIAYQIYDDCLDLFGNEADAGKTLGTDFEKGKLTLPLLVMLRQSENGSRGALSEMILQHSEDDYAAIGTMLREAGAATAARNAGVTLLHEAIAELDAVPENASTEALRDIAHYLDSLFHDLTA